MNDPAQNSTTHDKVIRMEEWKRGHEAVHDRQADEVKELGNKMERIAASNSVFMTKVLWAIIALMTTVTGSAIVFAWSQLG